ncbi:hypothetical protein R6Q59_035931 [Mikania micrantha]
MMKSGGVSKYYLEEQNITRLLLVSLELGKMQLLKGTLLFLNCECTCIYFFMQSNLKILWRLAQRIECGDVPESFKNSQRIVHGDVPEPLKNCAKFEGVKCSYGRVDIMRSFRAKSYWSEMFIND